MDRVDLEILILTQVELSPKRQPDIVREMLKVTEAYPVYERMRKFDAMGYISKSGEGRTKTISITQYGLKHLTALRSLNHD